MNKVEFEEAYQRYRGTLIRDMERKVSGSDAEEILHRALFGRPVKDRVAGGMYEDREGIPAKDFLQYARSYVKIEIKQWHREHQREVPFSRLVVRDEGSGGGDNDDWIPFDPSTHASPKPAERSKRDHAKRPACPPPTIVCPDCGKVLSRRKTLPRGMPCSCTRWSAATRPYSQVSDYEDLGIAAGVEPRYKARRLRVDESRFWKVDEDLLVARLVAERPQYDGWGDLVEKALADLPWDLRDLVRRIVIEKETKEAVARDWQQSPDVVRAELDRALERLRTFLKQREHLRPKIRWPITCACKSFEKAFPGRDLVRCAICGKVHAGRGGAPRDFRGRRPR